VTAENEEKAEWKIRIRTEEWRRMNQAVLVMVKPVSAE